MKGTYCLVISLAKDTKIKIGKVLGEITFKKGCYMYVGSAMNSLESRVRRHLSSDKKKHWHIDYLLLNDSSNVENVIVNVSDRKAECELAEIIMENEDCVAKFGCSDCSCRSHLIYFENTERANEKARKACQQLEIEYMELDEFEKFL